MTQMVRLFSMLLVLFMSMISCGKVYQVAEIKNRNYRIEKASFPVDQKVSEMIEPYKLKLDSTMNEVIGYCDAELVKQKPNSDLTNWFGDVLLEESQKLVTVRVDFALQNYGGIRIPTLSQGNVTVGKIFELMPFDNIMYILEMNGKDVQQLMNKIAENGGWPISHTVKMEIAYGKAIHIMINNEALDTNKTYIAAIPDYLANGGDDLDFLKVIKPNNTGVLIRDMLINNIRVKTSEGKHIESNKEIRIIE